MLNIPSANDYQYIDLINALGVIAGGVTWSKKPLWSIPKPGEKSDKSMELVKIESTGETYRKISD